MTDWRDTRISGRVAVTVVGAIYVGFVIALTVAAALFALQAPTGLIFIIAGSQLVRDRECSVPQRLFGVAQAALGVVLLLWAAVRILKPV
jgi:hypothetical protein